MDELGAMEAFGRTFVGGTRNDAAADGGGRREALPGRGGAGIWPMVGGFRRGGLGGLMKEGGSGRDNAIFSELSCLGRSVSRSRFSV